VIDEIDTYRATMKYTLVTFLLIQLAVPAAAQVILTGDVTHVRDGDTIEVGGAPVRL